MRRASILFLLTILSLPALALTASELFQQVNADLEASPWQARLVGSIVGPSGEVQEADMVIKVLPAEKIVRIEFQKPDALADNYVVITPKKVYNYLFLTNQVVVYPRQKARIEGLGFDLSRVGDLQKLGQEGEVEWGEPQETSLSGQPAWRVVGRTTDPDLAGFARVEVWIGQKPVRLLRTAFFSASGQTLSDLEWTGFEHTSFSREDLLSFPPDAEWIEKK
ncbi:outer membrane lipoprotein carrier protein LolA [Oceanithermus sp.]